MPLTCLVYIVFPSGNFGALLNIRHWAGWTFRFLLFLWHEMGNRAGGRLGRMLLPKNTLCFDLSLKTLLKNREEKMNVSTSCLTSGDFLQDMQKNKY